MSRTEVLEIFKYYGMQHKDGCAYYVPWENMFKIAEAISDKAKQEMMDDQRKR